MEEIVKVKLEKGVWLDTGDGDPSRTLVEENAYDFENMDAALEALADARTYRPFPNAEIVEDMF